MPKRGSTPIIPTAGAQGKRPKKALKKARQAEISEAEADEEDYIDDNDAIQARAESACRLLTIAHSRADSIADIAEDARAAAVLAEPDAPDKASKFLAWLIAPLDPQAFLSESFGKRPVLITREGRRSYFQGCFSKAELERQVRDCSLRWTDEIDAAKYTETGGRTTHNGDGVASSEDVWARYAQGCSIRLSWPQKHSDALWGVLEQLEEFFGSGGGCNAYLTPPDSQGFVITSAWRSNAGLAACLVGVLHALVHANSARCSNDPTAPTTPLL